MNVLVADSGATKTSWGVLSDSGTSIIQTSGMNPSLKVDQELESVIYNELIPQLDSKAFEHMFFYGAGCKAPEKSRRIKSILLEAFQKSKVQVKTDIAGAGRALYGKGTGIIVISGTGSSAGFMVDGELQDTMLSKSYPEGDFGSGCHIGALVLKDYFENDLPKEIQTTIDQNRTRSFDELFLLFQDPKKSKQIAAKAMRDTAHFKDHEYMKKVVREAVLVLLAKLKGHFGAALSRFPIAFNGKTAAYFEQEFRKVFKENGIMISEIQENPIHGLITFHAEQ